tara:strand:- start:2498 stop:2854 length:357 start_codon:yes stop_codon:yes gene_type:complete
MKYLSIFLIFFSSIAFAGGNCGTKSAYNKVGTDVAYNKVTMKVDGMQCAYSCAGKVSQIVQDIKGVKECEVDFNKGTATVVFDDKELESETIAEVLSKKTSYKVEIDQKKQKKDVGTI